MIDRYDPFGRGMGLRQMMDRLLEDAFVMPRQGGEGSGPALDAYEEGDTLVVEAHVSGFKPDDLDINVEQGVLTISGQTKAEQERKERNYLIREQRRAVQSQPAPAATYDADACTARCEDGVLRVVFPKSEAAKPRRIQIGGSGQQAMASGRARPRRDARARPTRSRRQRESRWADCFPTGSRSASRVPSGGPPSAVYLGARRRSRTDRYKTLFWPTITTRCRARVRAV